MTLFSSAGVGCHGFQMEGYRCIATNEIIERRMQVQRCNHKCEFDSGYIVGDITSDEIKQRIYDEIHRWEKKGNDRVDVIIATPPCQGISVINHKKNGKEKLAALWSEQLFKEGLVPKGYSGLPDKLLVANLHQDGYLNGMYVGYILAMMALVDNGTSKDTILAVRDYIRPNLMGHHFDDRDEFISQYKNEKYSWVEKEKG